jgi:predicted cobalt transporter CbtA
MLVDNWREGYKWISTYMFLIVAYIAQFGIPPELMATLPTEHQGKVIGFVAICGLIFRFIKQSNLVPDALKEK